MKLDTRKFADCLSLTNIAVDAANPRCVSKGGVLFNKALTALVRYPAGRGGDYSIPDGVTYIGLLAFLGCEGLTSVTIPDSVANIGDLAFHQCSALRQAYFQGNAPRVDGEAGSANRSVFWGDSGTVYYVPGTKGWGATFGGWPTAEWHQP